jgi:hypothetical protein
MNFLQPLIAFPKCNSIFALNFAKGVREHSARHNFKEKVWKKVFGIFFLYLQNVEKKMSQQPFRPSNNIITHEESSWKWKKIFIDQAKKCHHAFQTNPNLL